MSHLTQTTWASKVFHTLVLPQIPLAPADRNIIYWHIWSNAAQNNWTLQLAFHLERRRVKVKGNGQGSAQAGVQTQSEQLVDGQGPAEQLEGQDTPAALANRHWPAGVYHLTGRGQHRHRSQIPVLWRSLSFQGKEWRALPSSYLSWHKQRGLL